MLLYPLGYVAVESFFDVSPLRHPGWKAIGLGNYERLLDDPDLRQSLWATTVWTLGSVAVQFAIGLAAALALRNAFRGRSLARLLLLVPWAIPGVVGALAWKWVYHGQYGLLNALLETLGLKNLTHAWLGEPSTALGAVTVANIWRGFPFMMVMLIAGLANIPRELDEAAAVDGASYWQALRSITLPILRPVILVTTLLATIWTFNNFVTIYILTQGGPAGKTNILVSFVYQNGFEYFEFGYAAALSVLLFFVLLVPSVFYVRYLTRGERSS